MPGLLELTFAIQADRLYWSLDEGWVQPLLRVRGLKVFRLEQYQAKHEAAFPNVMFEPFRQRLTESMCATA